MTVTIGVDIGQAKDPTAICVVEVARQPSAKALETVGELGVELTDKDGTARSWDEILDRADDRLAQTSMDAEGRRRVLQRAMTTDSHHWVRHLERLPLGTSYPAVVDRIAAVWAGAMTRRGKGGMMLYLDATGVGRPVVDLLTQRRIPVRAVHFVAGTTYTKTRERGGWRYSLGKGRLVSRLQVLLQTGRLHLPADSPEAVALRREFADYERLVSDTGHATYGAMTASRHDDLVTAVGLAVLEEPFGLARPVVGSVTVASP